MRMLLALILTASVWASTTPAALQAATQRLQAAAKSAGVVFPLAAVEVRVHKEPHRLELWSGGKLVKTYAVGLGDRGLADKRRQGDHLTPEGRFYICNRNAQSAFHLFLGLSYPHDAAADRGQQAGLVTRRQRDAILRAQRAGVQPNWNTALGGAVGIHGGGSSSDWTWGCVAVENAEIEELWVACPLGTPVVVEAR